MQRHPFPLCALLMVLMAAGAASAYPPDHGPFRPGHEPPIFSLRELKAARETPTASGTVRHYDLGHSGTLEIHAGGDSAFEATIRSSTGAVLLPPAPLEGSLIGDVQVFSGRLNEDAAPDLVLETWSGGCGLAAAIGFRTILLSSGGRFVAVPVQFYAMSTKDFTDIDRDGRPEMIHTAFIDGEEGVDGRVHHYWVHNLLGFCDTSIVSRNAIHRNFPAWIQYKIRPNHRRTEQLSTGQRVRLWRTSRESWFPGFERLAEEQGR